MNYRDKLAEFCEPFFLDRTKTLTAKSLATLFIDTQLISEWPAMIPEQRHWCYEGIVQGVRALLRRHSTLDLSDPEEQMELTLSESSLLQDRYSVQERDLFGRIDYKYVPREMLTEEDVIAICKRARQLSAYYARYADALESWFYRAKNGGPRPPAGDRPSKH